MIKVVTESGSIYELYPDTRNWKRHRHPDANEIGIDTGIYSSLSYGPSLYDNTPCMSPVIGERMYLWLEDSHYIYIHSTKVVSVENV